MNILACIVSKVSYAIGYVEGFIYGVYLRVSKRRGF